MSNTSKAVFIDRDGTLNEMVYDETHGLMDSPRRTDQVCLVTGADVFLRGLKKLGYTTVVVTNQPGVAKSTLSIKELDAVNRRLASLLARHKAGWDGLRYCPHHPDGGRNPNKDFVKKCSCRKPKPGLLLDAARELSLDLRDSWMVGDGLNDVQAGRAAGCRTILVTSLKLEQAERFFTMKDCRPDAIAANLAEALKIIKRDQKR